MGCFLNLESQRNPRILKYVANLLCLEIEMIAKNRFFLLFLLYGISILALSMYVLPVEANPPIRIIVSINGHAVDFLSQLKVSGPDVCDYYHYHAQSGGMVTALDGTEIVDPNPGGCGYGLPGKLPSGFADNIPNDDDFDGLDNDTEMSLGMNKTNPDSDGDGTLDGSEDNDNDGLTNSEEANIHMSNPGNPDSNGNNIPDKVEIFLSTTAKDFTKIPVIVNILKNSTATTEHTTEAVDKANVVLKKAKVMLVLVKTNVLTENDGDNGGMGQGTAGDGILTSKERNSVRSNGGNEVDELPGMKGTKITFAKPGGVKSGSTTPGISVHENPTIIVEQRNTTDSTGATIAHEFGHVFTLEHPNETPELDDNENGNIMTPSNGGRDIFVNSNNASKGLENIEWTETQLEKIDTDGIAKAMGFQGTMQSPGQLKQFQYGSDIDFFNDQIGVIEYHDLNWTFLRSEAGDEFIHGLLTLYGIIPSSGAVDVTYSLLFDSDANSLTGLTIGSFTGVDKELVIQIHGDASIEPLTISGLIFDYGTFFNTPIDSPTLITIKEETDLDVSGVPIADHIRFKILKSVLGLSANNVPVGVMVRDLPDPFSFNTEFDTTSFTYDRDLYLEVPTLSLVNEFAKTGDMILFDVVGLNPNSSFDLRVDDVPVLSDTTDTNGDFSGNFVFPDLSSGFHFLTAMDSFDSFAFNGIIAQVVPECLPPVSNDWMITESCEISSDIIAPASVIIQNNSLVTVNSMGNFTIPSGENLIIVDGSGLKLIQGSAFHVLS